MAEKKLLQLLDSISIDKNTNLLPTTLKDGVTCLGVEGDVAPLSMTEDATATASDIAEGMTAYVNNEKIEGTVRTVKNGVVGGCANTVRSDNMLQAIVVEAKMSNDTLIRKDSSAQTMIEFNELANLISLTSEKILSGNTIISVEGTATSDATATANDMVSGVTAYVNGEKIEGTLPALAPNSVVTFNGNEIRNDSAFSTVEIDYTVEEGMQYVLRKDGIIRLAVNESDAATAFGLTADKILEGNTILGVVGTAKQEEGTKVYGTLEELQAVTGTEGQFAIVNSGETFDGAYKYTNGAWVEMFSSRRYDNTLTPEEYEQAVATATDIQGGNV